VSRRRTILAVTAVACLAAVLMAGCSAETRQKILPIFFDGFSPEGPKPMPPSRRVRRDLLKEIEDLKRSLAEARAAAGARQEGEHPSEEPRKPIERARTWDEAAKLLPVTEGSPDWAKALADGVIAPRAGLDPKAAVKEIFPADVELATGDAAPGKVVFSHEVHTALLICTTCHRVMEKGVKKKRFVGTHEDCKVCHAKVSFTIKKCDRCHVEE
jgi:c(7)-type cytochrome triheme protein